MAPFLYTQQSCLKRKILYIQHAPRVGGSVISLKELVTDALSHGFDCTVVCVNEEVANFYKSIGAKTAVAPIAVFNHNTALCYKLSFNDCKHAFKQCIKFFFSFFSFLKIIFKQRPAIVHLNSSTLIPYLIFFKALRIRCIVHIREYIVRGRWGFRKSILRFLLNTLADQIIYISEVEFENLHTKKDTSTVIYNYVHSKNFFAGNSNLKAVSTKFRLVTLGGVYKIKGGDILLESLKYLDNGFELLVAGSEDPRKDPFDLITVEGQEYYDKIVLLLNDVQVSGKVNFVGRVNNPHKYLSQADALIFWTRCPHFPRPVFEGWLMHCHIIYYNPGFENTYINSETVNLVKGFDTLELKSAIEEVSSNRQHLFSKVEAGNEIARQCFTERNFETVLNCYHKLLK
jgi:glycosyltransferase involved in cell wall biosynthesis